MPGIGQTITINGATWTIVRVLGSVCILERPLESRTKQRTVLPTAQVETSINASAGGESSPK